MAVVHPNVPSKLSNRKTVYLMTTWKAMFFELAPHSGRPQQGVDLKCKIGSARYIRYIVRLSSSLKHVLQKETPPVPRHRHLIRIHSEYMYLRISVQTLHVSIKI